MLKIRAYKAGEELKTYNNFESMELQAIFKNKTKYNLEFYGDSSEILKTIMNIVFKDCNNVYASIFCNNYRIIDNVKACKFNFMSQIFNLILFEKVKLNIQYFDNYLIINIKELNIEYYIQFVK